MKEFWDALITWSHAQLKLDKQREAYDGYSWDYYAGYEINKVNELRDEAEEALNNYIDNRIELILGKVK